MKFSKKLLLTQVVALAASSAAFADSSSTHKLSNYLKNHIKNGDSILQPMLSDGVNGYGVNNELFLLRQKEEGALKDGVLYFNGRLNVAVDYNQSSPGSQSAVLNPGVDLAFTATKGWFTAFADLSNVNNDEDWAQSVIPGNDFANNGGGAKVYNNYGSSINLSQGFLMLGDFSKMPVYMLVGKKYVDFGSFANQSQKWQPLTNLFNQDRQTQVAAGFYTHGFHGAVTLFRAPWTTTVITEGNGYTSNQMSTMAATLSYGTSVNKFGLHGGISYTTNMNPAATENIDLHAHRKGHPRSNRVSAGIMFAEVNFNPITVSGSYASAMRAVSTAANEQGKPSAWDIGAKFNFNLINRANWLSVNYSNSHTRGLDTDGPENFTLKQWLFGWSMAVTKNLDATFQYGHLSATDKANTNVFALQANMYF
jgi:hypothetical protein